MKILNVLLLLLLLDCSDAVESKNNYAFPFSDTELDNLSKKKNLMKIESKYFETYIPITWMPHINTDTVFTAIDTTDNKRDNIAITYLTIENCSIDKILKLKEQQISESNNYKLINSKTQIIFDNKLEIMCHDLDIEVMKDKYKQRCFYTCVSKKAGILCCLTSSESTFKTKAEIVDMTASYLMKNLK
jgi:hypothetical protein